jgi:hypothetical protein
MPQLDKFIILTQLKIFVILFIGFYFLFLFIILPRINLNLRIRKNKLDNLFGLAAIFKTYRVFSYSNIKFYLLRYLFLNETLINKLGLSLKEKLLSSFYNFWSFLYTNKNKK